MSLDAFVSSACSTSLGKVSEAGERVLWNDNGTPSGRAFILYVPPSGQSFDERRVQRAVSVVTVQREQIVDITSHGQLMHCAIDAFGHEARGTAIAASVARLAPCHTPASAYDTREASRRLR
eukprot:3491591-Pleurochrysis_carterae.AAC.1